ncbi:MAG: hypothetical protein ACRD10_14800 [Terriglobia bacterium]
MLNESRRRHYAVIGLGALILLGISGTLPGHLPLLAAQQMQRFPATPGAPPLMPPRIQAPAPPPDSPDALSPKQKNAIITSNFKKTKQDTAKLRSLVESLEKELARSNADVLSVHIVESANKIEKLARKIKNEAKGY